ncbi:GGDEF domain-containing protein [Methylobacterium aquaticum]|uniref:GGDEF domain-containing protein n=1 Tax=Methylobacterium aquaticum TaxID=270351 RepID=UPI003D16D914
MISVGMVVDLLSVAIASQALVPLRDVARLTRDPAVKRGWHALIAAVIACMLAITVGALRDADAPLDIDAAMHLFVHVVGISIVTALARLARRTAQDVIRLAAFEAQAFTDGLTGLGNRRLFTARLEEETARSRETGAPLSLIMLDIDHFKRINDTYGHANGDVVLRRIADAVMAGMRNADTVCRIGGEEMAIIMPRIDPAQAAEMADALRAAVGAMAVPMGDGRAITATVSLGFATRQPEESGDSLFRRADAALYAAKRGGRDRLSRAA